MSWGIQLLLGAVVAAILCALGAPKLYGKKSHSVAILMSNQLPAHTDQGVPSVVAKAPDEFDVGSYVDAVLLDYEQTKTHRPSVLVSNSPSSEGLGSRMTGFLSGFYLALALNFSLAVHWSVRPRLVEDKLAQMVPLEELFITNHSLVDVGIYTPDRTMFLGYAGARKRGMLRRSLDYWGCSDFLKDLKDLRYFKFTTTVWVLPIIRRNAAVQYNEWIRRTVFYKGLYRKLSAFLLRPTLDVASRTRHLSSALLTGVNICAHARSQDDGILRNVGGCIKKIMETHKNQSMASHIYLASDNQKFRSRMAAQYQGKLVTSGQEVTRNSDNAVKDALVELLLLQQCSGQTVFTPQSTFSVLAFAGRHEHHLSHRADTCEEVELFEPCFRLWHFLHRCSCHTNLTIVPWKLAWTTVGYGMVECITEKL